MKRYLILLGIFLIGFISAVPTINEITLIPGEPTPSEDLTICANITDYFSDIILVRINLLHSENPLWRWGLIMYEEGELYCRTISPTFMNAYEGMKISYYISARNLLNDLAISPTDYFIYSNHSELNNESGYELEESKQDEHKSSSHTSNIDQPCEPNWKCEKWSACNKGIKTRACYDINNCEYSYDVPSKVASCKVEEKVFSDNKNNNVLYVMGISTIITLLVLLGILIKR